jgi:hypothetical protein
MKPTGAFQLVALSSGIKQMYLVKSVSLTGDIVRPILPTGKFAGTHVGRLTVRKSGVFEIRTAKGKVSPVRHKYCNSIHRNDGYMYAFSTNVQQISD